MPIKIKKAFIEQYEGKKVPKEWQKEYGKTYSKKEAEQIFYKWENKFKKS
jgi:hypothetical protein